MIKKKKNGFLKAAGIMLAVMMLAACVISGTLAKYISEGTVKSGSLSLTVASWDIDVMAAGDIDSHRLGDSGFSPEISSLDWTILANADDDVTATPAKGTIAPGTWGYAEILTITNNGDVNAIVAIEGLDTFLPDSYSNLEFKSVAVYEELSFFDLSSYSDLDSLDSLADEGQLSEGAEGYRIEKNGADNSIIYIYVCYYWAFDGNDTTDTDMAGNSIDFNSTTLTITAEQAQTVS